MKTKIFSLAIIIIVLLAGNTLAGDFFTVGVKNSFNLSNVHMTAPIEDRIDFEIPDTQFKTGFAIGAYCNIPITDYVSLQPEAFYTSRGYTVEIDSINFRSNTTMNYLEFPILSVFKVVNHFNLFMGPSISVYLDGKVHESKTEEAKGQWFPWDDISNKDTRAIGLGFVAGGEFTIDRYSIGARYNLGLNDASNDPDINIMHRGIQVMIGIDLY